MGAYDEYIREIKGAAGPADYGRLFLGLERRIEQQKAERPRVWLRSGLAGALTLLVIGLAFYFAYPAFQGGNDQLMSYVFGQSEVTDGPVIDYVFSN